MTNTSNSIEEVKQSLMFTTKTRKIYISYFRRGDPADIPQDIAN